MATETTITVSLCWEPDRTVSILEMFHTVSAVLDCVYHQTLIYKRIGSFLWYYLHMKYKVMYTESPMFVSNIQHFVSCNKYQPGCKRAYTRNYFSFNCVILKDFLHTYSTSLFYDCFSFFTHI